MSQSSHRKHRAPFRPVDTFSSSQKPAFKPPTKPKPTTLYETDDSDFPPQQSTSLLGDSSTLFDDIESPESHTKVREKLQTRLKMVREREAPGLNRRAMEQHLTPSLYRNSRIHSHSLERQVR
ncbi:hypothetical protein P3342_000286 [Pyrenophora teres f. teres]|nr:hypothetical protein P3342_000286 [Pyrenophora teres f. teres]